MSKKRLTAENKARLCKKIKDKISGRIQTTEKKLAEEFNTGVQNIRRYTLQITHDLRVEKIIESYETEIRRLKALVVDTEGQIDEILRTLYLNCIDNKDTNACIAWLRGTGRMKEAEIKAKKKKSGDTLDWRTVVSELED